MSSTMDKEAYAFDPNNSLLWRAHPRRLDAESIRDNMLAVSGQLDSERPHGSEIARAGFVRIRNGVLEELSLGIGGMTGGGRMATGGGMKGGKGKAGKGKGKGGAPGATSAPPMSTLNRLDMADATFRSIFLPQARDETPRSLDVFDGADSNTTVDARATSDTADQALYLLNNPFVLAQSRAFAERVAKVDTHPSEQVRHAFLLAYGRPPSPSENRAALELLKAMPSASAPLAILCQSLFASAEFRYAY